MSYTKDIIGTRFGRLTVIEKAGVKQTTGKAKSLWLCRCDCGNEKIVLRNALVSGNTKSCGCLGKEIKKTMHIKHGMAKTRIWKIWCDIKDRCNNNNNSDFHYYGERGVSICDEWESDFQSFYKWSIENCYSDDLTIDRIDVNGNYEPNNCRWVTRKVQTRNRNITKKAFYNGVMRPVGEIAEIKGISYQKAYDDYVRRVKNDSVQVT